MEELIQQIRDIYATLPNAKKTVASFFLNHFQQLQFLTITELAEQIGVSDTTIINFCKDLGFRGYAAAKKAIRDAVQMDTRALAQHVPERPVHLSQLLCSTEKNLQDTFNDPQNIQAIVQAVDAIRRANRIYAVGFWYSACCANDLCLELRRNRQDAHAIVPDMGDWVDKILLVQPGDVVILYDFSLYLAALTEICSLLKQKNIPIILITDMGPCPRAGYADILIRCRNKGSGKAIPYAINQALLTPLILPRNEGYEDVRQGVFSRFNDYGVLETLEGRNERI